MWISYEFAHFILAPPYGVKHIRAFNHYSILEWLEYPQPTSQTIITDTKILALSAQ